MPRYTLIVQEEEPRRYKVILNAPSEDAVRLYFEEHGFLSHFKNDYGSDCLEILSLTETRTDETAWLTVAASGEVIARPMIGCGSTDTNDNPLENQ